MDQFVIILVSGCLTPGCTPFLNSEMSTWQIYSFYAAQHSHPIENFGQVKNLTFH